MIERLQRAWWTPSDPLSLGLAPLGWLWGTVTTLRLQLYRHGVLAARGCGAPLLVVGNVTLGGTGKTPLVAELVRRLRRRGCRPGIVARGYGGLSEHWPRDVDAGSDPSQVGDEPVLLAGWLAVPVVVAPDRLAAARRAVQVHGCDVLVADDGLQHLRLHRDAEIAVVDAQRGLGNGRCLPSGPLRERPGRLRSVDLVLHAGGGPSPGFRLRPHALLPLGPAGAAPALELAGLRGLAVDAVAGIGVPQRFFDTLRTLGARVYGHAFPDHHTFTAAELARFGARPLLMTEKDAVRCCGLALPPASYALRVALELDAGGEDAVERLLDRLLGAGTAAVRTGSGTRAAPGP